MPNPKLHLLFLIIFFAWNDAKAQTYYEPEGSFSIDLGIPAKGKNQSFGRVMEGLFNGGMTYQYNLFKGITLGGGLKYSFFVLNPFALNNVPWNGALHIPAAYLKLGYEKFTTERISFSGSVRMGYSAIIAVHGNDSCEVGMDRQLTEGAFFVEPQFELALLTEKTGSDAFSLFLGYSFYLNEFGPRYLCMESFPGLIEEDYQGITRFFSFGFGYRYYMGRK